MPLPQPEDLADRIRALEREVRDLRSSITNAGGRTSASQGWVIGNMSSPPTPSGGGHIYASGGEPFWKDSSGSVNSLITPPFSGALIRPQYPSSFDSPASIVNPPTANDYNLLRADAAMLQVCIRDIINQGATTSPQLWPSS